MKPWMLALIGGTTVLGLGLLSFSVIDLSAEAEPGWLERNVAFPLLAARIVLAGGRADSAADNDSRAGDVYRQRCAFCHGAVDGTPASFARSLSPRPPQFFAERPRASVAVDAYIIRHGIRWTGMPAFRTMSAADAWRIASWVHRAQKDTVHDPLSGLRPFLAGVTVPDAEQAARWYRDNLGFTVNGSTTVNGLRQVVVERGPYAIELLSTNAPGPHGVSKLGFVVDDLDPVLAELERRHVHIVQGLTTLQQFQVRFVLIQDSNGNVIQLFDRKA
jgi:mono/diheme cytochrome c family protein/predicted enzyme related to lactoylglutathione lyase